MEYLGMRRKMIQELKDNLDHVIDNTNEPNKWRTYTMAKLIIREWEDRNHLLPDEAIKEHSKYVIDRLGI